MYILITYSVDAVGYVDFDDNNAYGTLDEAKANLYNYIYHTFLDEEGFALNFTYKLKKKLIKDFGDAVCDDFTTFDIWSASDPTPYVEELRENFKALTVRIINSE